MWLSRRRALPPAEDMDDLPEGVLGGHRGDALDGHRGRQPAAGKRQGRDEGQRKIRVCGLGSEHKLPPEEIMGVGVYVSPCIEAHLEGHV